ncbi:MAG TPA: hypothetical protein VHM00_10790 [Caldimonas sp.]|jgi:hypothetical protein|nr:hypothetical protein [Caldimonas sp.]HEX2541555.1 hypothetical protein [Caldimonas sp.]
MKIISATLICTAFLIAGAAGAANVPVPPAKKATAAEPAAVPGAKTVKGEGAAPKKTGAAPASEALTDPYSTPLLLNARPLSVGRP